MSTYDLSHAVPISGSLSGQLTLKTRNAKVTGMQKAIQNLVVVLLSEGGPIDTGIDFYAKLKRGYYRDKATLSADLDVYSPAIFAIVNDSSRPDNETIASITVNDIIVNIDSAVINLGITFASGDATTYDFPVNL